MEGMGPRMREDNGGAGPAVRGVDGSPPPREHCEGDLWLGLFVSVGIRFFLWWKRRVGWDRVMCHSMGRW